MAAENGKGAPRRRRQMSRGGRGGAASPIMWLAVVVCLIGAVILFRSDGGYGPTGLGDQTSVVTAPDIDSTLSGLNIELELPRSGDVDITDQTRDLTPETPVGQSSAAGTAGATTPAPPQDPVGGQTTSASTATPPPGDDPTAAPTRTPRADRPAPPPIVPHDSGPYVVQVGSFGEAENANKEAARLRKLGFAPLIKVGNLSDGALIYRVRIAYFKTRAEAEAFIRQNRKHIAGAIPAHR